MNARPLLILAMLLVLPAQASVRATFERQADALSVKYSLPSGMLKAVCRIESNWEQAAIGDDGRSIGLCQIQIDTALALYGKHWQRDKPEAERRAIVRRNLLNPTVNMTLAAILLRRYLDRFGGDETIAILAYNGGPDNMMIRHLLRYRAARAHYQERTKITCPSCGCWDHL